MATSPFGGTVPIRYDTVTTPVKKGGFIFSSEGVEGIRPFATVTGALRPTSETEEVPAGILPFITTGDTNLGDVTLTVPESAFAAKHVNVFKWISEAEAKLGLVFWVAIFGAIYLGAKAVSKLVAR